MNKNFKFQKETLPQEGCQKSDVSAHKLLYMRHSRSVRFTETNQELGSLGLSWVRVGLEEPNPSSEN